MRLLVGGLFLLGLLAEGRRAPAEKQRFVKEPASSTVQEGGLVVLGCRVEGRAGELQWTRDDFGLGTEQELLGYSRYWMEGEDLHIANVSLAEDDARFQCQVGATETTPPLRSRYATLRVVAAPRPPVITAGPRMLVRAGRRALVQCISKGGRPAAQVRWWWAGKPVSEGVEEKIETLEDGKRTMTVSTLTFLVERNMTGSFLECEATSEAEGQTERRVGTTLKVEYEPVVELVADREALYEGDMVRLACRAEARPELVEYQWWVAGQEVEEARGAGELLLEAERSRSGQTVTCLARNKLGQGSADYQLLVHYSPVWLATPEDMTGDPGDRVRLECSVDAHPDPTYLWHRDGNLVGKGRLLSFPLSSLTAGHYTCTASVPGFSPLVGEADVRVRGPPALEGGPEGVQGGARGETLHIHCEARAVPQPSSFIWSFKGDILRGDSPVYSMIETQHGDGVRSTLIINRAREEHFGDYECLAANAVGETRRLVRLRQEDGPPLLVVVSAGIAGLLLTTVVLAIGLACRRYHSGKGEQQWPKQANGDSSCSHSSLSEEDSLGPEYQSANASMPVDYQQFTGSKDLLASLAPTHPYSSPYLQSSTPTLPGPGSAFPSPDYLQQCRAGEPGGPRAQHSPASSRGYSSPGLGSVPGDRPPAHHHASWLRGFTTDVAGEELNTTSIGTHV